MIGISKIASYIPIGRVDNKLRYPEVSIEHLEKSVGVLQVSKLDKGDRPSDLCRKAFENLQKKIKINISDIELIVVVTQHTGTTLPSIATEVHGHLNASEKVICFDLSIGCSGYVQGLSIVLAYIQQLGLKKALLFNVETLSVAQNEFDRELNMLFGDAATVTLLDENPLWIPIDYNFGTNGKLWQNLYFSDEGYKMNGLGIYDFVIRSVPKAIRTILEKNQLLFDDIDFFAFHQASQRTLESLIHKLKIDPLKAPIKISEFGNTGSCSIPILIENEIENKKLNTILLCGFGAGMAWANTILKRKQ